MLKYIAAAIFAGLLMSTSADATAAEPPPQPDPANVEFIVDHAAFVCEVIAIYDKYDVPTDDTYVSHIVAAFESNWAGVDGLDVLSALYRGIATGCIAAID